MKKRTSSVFRVDEQAYLTMGAVCLIALLVLAFRYGTSHACYPIKIVPTAASFTVGSPVTLKAETRGGKTFDWNFGDGSTTTEYDPVTLHTYLRAGKYTVVITLDGQCTEMQVVSIGEAPLLVNVNLSPDIVGPDTAYVGKPVKYWDDNPGSTAWAWRFEDPQMVDAFTKEASYIYKTAGIKKIILQINHRPDLTSSRSITVIDKQAEVAARAPKSKGENHVPKTVFIPLHDSPTTPKLQLPTPPEVVKKEEPKSVTAQVVSDDKLESMLLQVVDGTMVQDDFAGYLCNNLNLTIQYNGTKTTFSAMCADLKKLKRRKIKQITVIKQTAAGTNCIISMDVTVKKKWL